MKFAPMLAMIDMRGNLIAAAILLVVGVVVFRLVRPPNAVSTSRRWLPIVAFVSGPTIAFLWTIADVLWVFTQGRGFDFGASFGLQFPSLRCRVLVCHAADTATLAA